MNKIPLLDHGYIGLVEQMGDDLSIIRNARQSFGEGWRAGENEANDSRLMRRLWSGVDNKTSTRDGYKLPLTPKHSTPFEAVTFTFAVKAPIFVFRQWHRHRTFSYNELSARYKELPEEFYVPALSTIGSQSKDNKQGRDIEQEVDTRIVEVDWYEDTCKKAFNVYRTLVQLGWPKELARCVLPFSTYSQMSCTVNLLNLFRFCTLRSDSHAQYEIRVYSDAMIQLIKPFVPEAVDLWVEGNYNR